MGSAKTPKVPDPAKTYEQGIQTNIKYAPQLAAAEDQLRGQYDSKSVQENLDRQQQYGGQALDMYQGYLNDVDGQGQQIRSQLGNAVSNDLARGHRLDPGMAREENNSIRAAEISRGNTSGNSAVSAEALNTGSAAERMYQQRLANAGTFLAGDTSIRDLNSVAGLATAATNPDRSFSYVNPLSGQQGQNVALQYYQAALQGGAQGGGNPWTAALASSAGSAVGAYAGSAGGRAAISGAGSAIGNYLSSFGSAAGG